MFNKKGLEEVSSKIDSLNSKIDENNKAVSTIKMSAEDNSKKLIEKIDAITTKQVSYFDEFDKSLTVFNDMNIMYRKEFDSLGNFKNQLAEKLLEKVSKEMKDEMQKHFSKLELEKRQFEGLSRELEALKLEIQKLKSISETIKSMDFELVNYSKKLLEQDNEKLRLMSQIDNLQRLVAKIRHGKHQ